MERTRAGCSRKSLVLSNSNIKFSFKLINTTYLKLSKSFDYNNNKNLTFKFCPTW